MALNNAPAKDVLVSAASNAIEAARPELVGIAQEKARLKREEVRKLEESGEIPTSLDQIELY